MILMSKGVFSFLNYIIFILYMIVNIYITFNIIKTYGMQIGKAMLNKDSM